MTDVKKREEDKSSAKTKKLRLNKETIKDLGAGKNAQVKGGAPTQGERCTQRWSDCTIG